MTEQEEEIKRVVSYIRSCRNAGIDTTITIDKGRSHFILNALEEIQQYRDLDDKLQMEIGITVKELYEQWNVMLAEYLEYQQLGTVEDFKNKINDVKTLSKMYEKLNDQEVREYRKLEKYEALGTVKELKSKIEELKRWHTDHIVDGIKNEFANTSTLICHNCDHKDEYIMELEVEVEELREARKKQIPKTPYMWGDGYSDGKLVYDMYDCPNCGESYEIDGAKYDFCPNCGQAIDWREKE